MLEQAARSGRRDARSTNIDNPGRGVEFREECSELPASGADGAVVGAGLDSIQDGDTLDREDLETDSGLPSKDNDIASYSVDVKDIQTNGRLRALTGNVYCRRWESDTAQGDTGEEVDRVGGISESWAEEVGRDIDIEGSQGGDELLDYCDGGVVGNAFPIATTATGVKRRKSGGQTDQADRGEEAEKTHCDFGLLGSNKERLLVDVLINGDWGLGRCCTGNI